MSDVNAAILDENGMDGSRDLNKNTKYDLHYLYKF